MTSIEANQITSLDPFAVALDVKNALLEDVGDGDVTAALLPATLLGEAIIQSREPMLVCGLPWINEVFRQVDPHITVDWLVAEGDWLDDAQILCTIYGSVRNILTAERTALNFLQTLSATATQTYRYRQKLGESSVSLLDTRKTIPGLRKAQKYAVRCGGGMNHRMGLYDAYLIKENHIAACGSISKAVHLAREHNKHLFVEVEVENLEELREAIKVKPDRILLDNFTLAMLKEAVQINQPKVCELEASGGIDSDQLAALGEIGIDYISVGAITKSIKAIDLSLLVRSV